MPNFIEYMIFFSGTAFGGLLFYFIRTLVDYNLARVRSREDRRASKFNEAAERFRTIIFTQFKGIYPITRLSAEEINNRILDTNSITEIEAAVIEFSYLLSNRQRTKFIKAMTQYQETYKTFDWKNQQAHVMFPSMRHLFKSSPKQILFNHIEDLLKFTDELK